MFPPHANTLVYYFTSEIGTTSLTGLVVSLVWRFHCTLCFTQIHSEIIWTMIAGEGRREKEAKILSSHLKLCVEDQVCERSS